MPAARSLCCGPHCRLAFGCTRLKLLSCRASTHALTRMRSHIPDEAVVARYSGRLYSRAAFDAAGAAGETSGDYALELMPGWIIDGEDAERSSWARYINHSLRRRNCFAFSGPGFVYFKATKDIPKGGELFFQYGPDYWEDRAPERSWRRIAIDLL